MTTSHKPPVWFWVVSVMLLLWNLMGLMAYVQEATMTAAQWQAMAPAERALLASRPAWATAAFAIAVFGGAAGCLMLLLRSRLALLVLVLSFVGVLVQMGQAFLIADSFVVYGPGGLIMPAAVTSIAAFLVFFAAHARKRGWLD
jgi:hypothetical protein